MKETNLNEIGEIANEITDFYSTLVKKYASEGDEINPLRASMIACLMAEPTEVHLRALNNIPQVDWTLLKLKTLFSLKKLSEMIDAIDYERLER